MKDPVVVDSSVVVKWFIREESDDAPALQLLKSLLEGKRDFIIPDLLFYEVGNVFLKKWSQQLEKMRVSFDRLWHLPWFFMPLRQSLLSRALEMASQYHITFYDALFVATAERAEASLVTADLKLIARIKAFPFVQSL